MSDEVTAPDRAIGSPVPGISDDRSPAPSAFAPPEYGVREDHDQAAYDHERQDEGADDSWSVAYAWLRRRDPVRWTLGVMVVGWSAVFIVLGWLRQTRFATFSFDLGIYDQGVWLLSRFKDPFVTVRGLELFGHHVNVILLAFVPFYWLGAGPKFLLVVQVVAQASGAIAIFLLARDRLASRWLGVAMAGALLLNPTYQFLTWEFFHPDALAIAPLLFAYWAARAGRWRWFTVAALLALACKEDVALAVAVMGILIAVRGRRKIGVLVTLGSLAWYAVATRMIIPFSNGIGPFYDTFFGNLGKNPAQVAGHVVTHPGQAFDLATRSDRVTYYWQTFAPFAFLPLLGLPVLLIGGPMLGVNILSSFPYTRDYRYHYSALVIVGLVLGTVEAIAFVGRNRAVRRALVAVVLAASVAATVAWGASPIGTKYDSGIWPLQADRQTQKAAAVAMVPDGAPTSAIYNLLPHLAHRTRIYDFPVPWRDVNWGVHGEHLDDPAGVQWIVVDLREVSADDRNLLDSLLAYQFRLRYLKDDILVAQRVHAPPPTSSQPSTTQPGATQPSTTQPGATQPSAAQPSASQPVVSINPK